MKGIVVGLAILVAVLGGFYGGYKVGQNNVVASTPASSSNRGANGQFPGGGRNFAAACPSPGATPAAGSPTLARGTVTNLSSGAMTVAQTGCDVKVTFTPTTTVQKQVAASTSDLSDNQTVTVNGTRQADGSILATSIQIGGGNPRGPGGGSSSGGGG
jgi:Domain of unknown function (DUF5666)